MRSVCWGVRALAFASAVGLCSSCVRVFCACVAGPSHAWLSRHDLRRRYAYTTEFSARSWALLRFMYFDVSHGWICACVHINSVAVWKAVEVRSALTFLVLGIYWGRALRRCDAVCETRRDLVESVTQHMRSALLNGIQQRQRSDLCRTLRNIGGKIGCAREEKLCEGR